jgi:large subunit ribosomal protein L1
MSLRSVKYKKQAELRGDAKQQLACEQALAKIKEMADVGSERKYKGGRKRKGMNQTVNLVLHLGIDPKQADQMLRGSISLPKGIGRTNRVVAFCEGALIDQAKAAGAAEAGGDDLIKKITDGWTEFDVAVAHPSLMGKVGKLGRVLGPQGKMPSPKAGTVTPNVADAVKEYVAGKIEFRNDAGGNIHLPVGKVSFSVPDLKENVEAAIKHMTRLRPTTSKGTYIKKVTVSATQTPGVEIALAT